MSEENLPTGEGFTFVEHGAAGGAAAAPTETAGDSKHPSPRIAALMASLPNTKRQFVTEETFTTALHQFVVYLRRAWPDCEELESYEETFDMIAILPFALPKRRKGVRRAVIELHEVIKHTYSDVAGGDVAALMLLEHDVLSKTKLRGKWTAINKPKHFERFAPLRAGIVARIQQICRILCQCMGEPAPVPPAAASAAAVDAADASAEDDDNDNEEDTPTIDEASPVGTGDQQPQYIKADLFITAVLQLVDVMGIAWNKCKKIKAYQKELQKVVALQPGNAERVVYVQKALDTFYNKAHQHFQDAAEGRFSGLTMVKHPVILRTNFRKKWVAINRAGVNHEKYATLRTKITAFVQHMCNIANSCKSIDLLPDDIKLELAASVKSGIGPDGQVNAAAVFGDITEKFMNMDKKKKIALARKLKGKHNKKTAMGMMQSSMQMAKQLGVLNNTNTMCTPKQMQELQQRMAKGEPAPLAPEIDAATSVE
jgi:hypothetical protein